MVLGVYTKICRVVSFLFLSVTCEAYITFLRFSHKYVTALKIWT